VKRVITAVILIPLVVIALFKAPLWLFALLVFGVALLAVHEYLGIAKAQGFQPMVAATYLFLTLTIALFYFMTGALLGLSDTAALRAFSGMVFFWGLPVVALFSPLIYLLLGLSRDPLSQAVPSAAVSYLALPYIGFTLGELLFFQEIPAGALYLLFLMLLVWCGDIAAYYVGRAIGKHKLAPRISPGKTWEGAAGSVFGAVILGLLLFRFVNPIADFFQRIHLLRLPSSTVLASLHNGFTLAPFWLIVLFAICVNVSAQLGDLVESAMKRGAGVKDSGTLLPGHGGVLDRIDALLFALPVGLIFYIAGLAKYFTPAVSPH
jgi:phosphatidate cytidylyltransferase